MQNTPAECRPREPREPASKSAERCWKIGFVQEPGVPTSGTAQLNEPEIKRSYIAAREVKEAIESPDSFDLGEVPIAVEAYRDLYRLLIDDGSTAGHPA